jgi:hypothetical protein
MLAGVAAAMPVKKRALLAGALPLLVLLATLAGGKRTSRPSCGRGSFPES